MPLVTAVQLTQLLQKIGEPLACYKNRRAIFMVYRAKDLYSSRWNGALRGFAAAARSSYMVYGDRPIFDQYDEKSAIYLVRVIYRQNRVADNHREEWLSIRMTPGDGKPLGVGEIEIFERKQKSIDHWMKQKLGEQDFWRRVASSSRMCGIHPYTLNQKGQAHFLRDATHRFTPLCFALIHAQFLIDYPSGAFPFWYITAVIRPDFCQKGLKHASGKQVFRPAFMSAEKFLNFSSGEISVRREIYAYRFPLYWFDAQKMLVLINGLRAAEKKPPLKILTPPMLYGLGKLREQVPVAGLSMSSHRLRRLIDRLIPEIPQLQIMHADNWYTSMHRMIKAANIVRYL